MGMNRYKMYEVSDADFQRILDNQLANKRRVYEERVGQRRKLYVDSTIKFDDDGKPAKVLLCTNKVPQTLSLSISEKDFMLFLAQFRRELNKNLKRMAPVTQKDAARNFVVGKKNFDVWKSIPIGACFYNIDIKNAYWQMAHKLGYVGDKMFDDYFDLDSYKEAMRLCISFLGRSKKVINHNTNKTQPVDTSIDKQVFLDVRTMLYTYITNVIELLNGEYVSYITDGIYIKNDKVDVVRKYLKDNDIVYKITRCQKLSDTTYNHGARLSNFTKNTIAIKPKEKSDKKQSTQVNNSVIQMYDKPKTKGESKKLSPYMEALKEKYA